MYALDAKFREEGKSKPLGASDSRINAWRRGEGVPSDKNGISIAQALGIDPNYVLACLTAARHGEMGALPGQTAHADHTSAIRTMNSFLEKAATYYEEKARQQFQKAEQLRTRIRESSANK
jgi:hypothetical protein